MYRANTIVDVGAQNTVKVMTWNIRFGVARLRFFGDGCGDRVVLKGSEVLEGLEGLAEKLSRRILTFSFSRRLMFNQKKRVILIKPGGF